MREFSHSYLFGSHYLRGYIWHSSNYALPLLLQRVADILGVATLRHDLCYPLKSVQRPLCHSLPRINTKESLWKVFWAYSKICRISALGKHSWSSSLRKIRSCCRDT